MNKKNKILIACLALLLTLSVGYALFSDTITINGTATAKGEFELTTTCYDFAHPGEGIVGDSNNSADMGSISNAKISCLGNEINASATLGYPGTEKWFGIAVTNTGSIPAKLKKVVDLNNDENYCESGACGGIIGNHIANADRTNHVSAALYPDGSFWDDYSTEGEGYGWEPSFSEEQMDAILDPGETAYFYIEMYWETDSTTPGEPLVTSLNAQLDWQQVTN